MINFREVICVIKFLVVIWWLLFFVVLICYSLLELIMLHLFLVLSKKIEWFYMWFSKKRLIIRFLRLFIYNLQHVISHLFTKCLSTKVNLFFDGQILSTKVNLFSTDKFFRQRWTFFFLSTDKFFRQKWTSFRQKKPYTYISNFKNFKLSQHFPTNIP
jgi:hypothetical protein